jgi:hypothetical protein
MYLQVVGNRAATKFMLLGNNFAPAMKDEEVDLFTGGDVGIIEQVRLKAKWNPVKAVTLVRKSHGETEEYDFTLLQGTPGEWVYKVHQREKRGVGQGPTLSMYNIFLGILTFVCLTSIVLVQNSCSKGGQKRTPVVADENESRSFVAKGGAKAINNATGAYQGSQGDYGSHGENNDWEGNYGDDSYDDTRFENNYDDYDDGSSSPDYTKSRNPNGKSRLDVV